MNATVERSAARRMTWTVADQALSSATNFGMSVLAARASGAREFGALTVGFSTYLVAMGVSRALAAQPLVIRYSGAAPEAHDGASRAAAGTAVSIGAAGASVLACASAVAGGRLGAYLLTFALLLPPLLLQDLWRYALVSSARPRSAAINDGSWLIAQAVLTVGVGVASGLTGRSVVLAWGAGASCAAFIGVRQCRALPNVLAVRRWLRRHRDISVRLVVEFVGVLGGSQVTINVLALVAGLEAAGALRAAQVVFGPLTLLFQGVLMGAVPEAARLHRRAPHRLFRHSDVLSLLLALVAAAITVIMLVIPNAVGVAILGESWRSAHAVLLPVGFGAMAAGACVAPTAALYGMGAVDRSMRTRLIMLPLAFAGGVLGAVLGGAVGAASGLAIANVAGALVYRRQLWSTVIDRDRERVARDERSDTPQLAAAPA